MKNAIMLISFLLLPLLAHADMDMEKARARRGFLLDLEERIAAFQDINKVSLHFLLNCLNGMSDQDFANAKYPAHGYKPYAKCADSVGFLKDNTLAQYPQMRKDLLRSQLLTGASLDLLLVRFEQNVTLPKASQKGMKVLLESASIWSTGLAVTNPLSVSSHLTSAQLPNPDFTVEEMSVVTGQVETDTSESFNRNWHAVCDREVAAAEQRYFGSPADFTFCKDTNLRMTDTGLMLVYEGKKEPRTLFHAIDIFRDFATDWFRTTQAAAEQDFMTNVQLNPWVALVKQARPSRQELIGALSIMVNVAEETANEYFEKRKQYHMTEDDEDDTALLENMAMLPVAQSLLKPPFAPHIEQNSQDSSVDVADVFARLTKEYNRHRTVQLVERVGLAIGANVALCWFPISRGGRMIAKFGKLEKVGQLLTKAGSSKFITELFDPFCFPIASLATNLGLAAVDIHEYNGVYRQVFSSPEQEHLIRDVNSLSTAERDVFWSVLLAPFGNGISTALKARYGERIFAAALKKTNALKSLIGSRSKMETVQQQLIPVGAHGK